MTTRKTRSSDSLDFFSATELLRGQVSRISQETIVLGECLSRVPGRPLSAFFPQPGYDQSMRDGYALAVGRDDARHGMGFQIIGEIPAGNITKSVVTAGTACRIMTGGMVPEGATRVVPQEDCVAQDGMVTIPVDALLRKYNYIQKKGDRIAEGDMLVAAGTILQPEHLALLATTGHTEIEVYRRPRVGFFCTGSELIDSPDELVAGLKISSNRYLLGGLVRQFLAEAEDLGIIKDSRDDLQQTFDRLKSAAYDVVISTGGMGPGKYDLIEEAFCLAGGQVIFRSLDMRPGRSTLFGKIGGTLFFGLPGPPEAVQVVFNEIVGPTLLCLQGVKECGHVTIQAKVQQRLELRNDDVLHFKGGILSFESGCTYVRLTDRLEIATCFILFPPGQSVYEPGSEVDVHLVYTPYASRLFAPA